MKISKNQLLKEIKEHCGNLSEIAKKYGLTYAAVHKRVNSDPAMSEALQEVREALVDTAQTQLRKAVEEGASWAVRFTLETWGRPRGFSKQIEVIEPTNEAQVVVYLPDNGRKRPMNGHAELAKRIAVVGE